MGACRGKSIGDECWGGRPRVMIKMNGDVSGSNGNSHAPAKDSVLARSRRNTKERTAMNRAIIRQRRGVPGLGLDRKENA